MRKIFSITLFSLVALSAVMLSSCKKEETTGEIKIVSLYITPIQTVVELNDSAAIKVHASFSNGSSVELTSEEGVSIESSNPTIISYDSKTGKIVGKETGKVDLTVSYAGLTDKSEAVCATVDHLVLTANYANDTILMLPLDTLNKKKDLTLTAVLKLGSSNEEYKKTIEPAKYELSVDAPDSLAIENDTLIVARESGAHLLCATYKNAQNEEIFGTSYVYVAKYQHNDVAFKVDVDITSESTDVMLLGSNAGIKAEANFIWDGVKKKEKGKTGKDTSTTVDIASKVLLFSGQPPILGVNETTVSALQIGDGFVYAYYTVTATEKDTLTRNVSVLNEESLKNPSDTIELVSNAVYAHMEINFKFYANYIRVNGTDTTNFRVDLTDTRNSDILSYCVTDSTIISDMEGKTCNGKMTVMEEEINGCEVAVIYEHSTKNDTAFSAPFKVYKKPEISIASNDTLYIGTYRNNSRDTLIAIHKDYKVVDNYGNDFTDSLKISEPVTLSTGKTGHLISLPVSAVKNRKLIVSYGPDNRTIEKFIEEVEQ